MALFESTNLLPLLHNSTNGTDITDTPITIHSVISLTTFLFTIFVIIIAPSLPVVPNFLRIYYYFKLKREMNQVAATQVSEEHNEQAQPEHHNEATEEHNSTQLDLDHQLLHSTQIQEHTTRTPILKTKNSLFQLFEKVKYFFKTYFINISIDLAIMPLISLSFLAATTTLNWKIFTAGIVGSSKSIVPYSVLLLFMSLSYLCVSLDKTGLFEYLAYWIIQKSKGRGHVLFISFGVFTSFLTVFTSNDIVILTLTPIICYMSHQSSNMNPTPFVVSQFFLANVWSIALEIGNPTNIIVAEAFHLNFIRYSAWMFLPAVVAGITTFSMLYIIFFKQIPKQILTKDQRTVEEEAAMDDMEADTLSSSSTTTSNSTISATEANKEKRKVEKLSAVVKALLLLLCLVVLAICSIFQVPSWIICLVFAGITICYDFIRDLYRIIMKFVRKKLLSSKVSNMKMIGHFIWKESYVFTTLKRMPWKIVPFALSMFIVVELLKEYGWITLFAKYITLFTRLLAGDFNGSTISFVRQVFSSIFVTSTIGSLACNVLNNQPMTILYTTMLQDAYFEKFFEEAQNELLKQGTMLSLIISSNLGANITLIGALAGIMWSNILQNNQIPMNYFKFLKYGLIITPIVISLSSLALSLEVVLVNVVWR